MSLIKSNSSTKSTKDLNEKISHCSNVLSSLIISSRL